MRIDQMPIPYHVVSEDKANAWAAAENAYELENHPNPLDLDMLCRVKPVTGGWTVVLYDVQTGDELGPMV